MPKHYLLFPLLCISSIVTAQNMGVGTLTPNAKLEVSAANPGAPTNQDGLLIPRVNIFPAVNPGVNQNGMIVFLTATVGDNLPGFYYWNNSTTTWQAVGSGKFWNLNGNSGINPSTNFLGTTDDNNLIFIRNNIRAGLLGNNYNTSWGVGALNPTSSGSNNTAMGAESMIVNTTGYSNTSVGTATLYSNLSGFSNTAFGSQALFSNSTGSFNTAVGDLALVLNNGSDNTAIGAEAGFSNVSGNSNIFIGNQAGTNETGSHKLYIQNNGVDASNALIYGEFDNKLLRSNGRMQIFSDNTDNDGLRVIKNYAPGTEEDQVGVLGQNVVDDFYGIGVQGRGGYIGVEGSSQGSQGGLYFGVRGSALGTNTGINYGVFGTAANGAINYAGYFEGPAYISGNLGVGVSQPLTKFALNGGTGEAFTILGGGDVRIYSDGGTASSLLYASGGTGANNATFTILSDGKTFAFNGTGGSVSSDARLKQDIVLIKGSLQKLMRINGYSYRFKNKGNIPGKELGVLAQEVKKVLPEAVFTNEDGTYSVSYNSLVPLLINSVKEQQQIINNQEARINRLEAQMLLLLGKSK